LNRGLLIYTKDRRVLRRLDVERDDVRGFLLEIRIVRAHVALESMRLQTGALPDTSYHHVVGAQVFGELARGPMRRTVRWRLARPFQDLRLEFRRTLVGLAAGMAREQAGEPILDKPLLPTTYVAGRTVECSRDLRIGLAAC
jgi:hypothetical protein